MYLFLDNLFYLSLDTQFHKIRLTVELIDTLMQLKVLSFVLSQWINEIILLEME